MNKEIEIDIPQYFVEITNIILYRNENEFFLNFNVKSDVIKKINIRVILNEEYILLGEFQCKNIGEWRNIEIEWSEDELEGQISESPKIEMLMDNKWVGLLDI